MSQGFDYEEIEFKNETVNELSAQLKEQQILLDEANGKFARAEEVHSIQEKTIDSLTASLESERGKVKNLYEALKKVHAWMGQMTAEECSDIVYIPVSEAIAAYEGEL